MSKFTDGFMECFDNNIMGFMGFATGFITFLGALAAGFFGVLFLIAWVIR